MSSAEGFPPEVRVGVGLYTGQRPDVDAHDPGSVLGSYQDLVPLAVAAEDAGFDSFWVSEHHGLDDGYLPSPLVALAAAAAATQRITLGTSLLLAPLHHPLRLAEDAAVLDQLARGRLVLGLGLGYAAEEYRAFGVDTAARGDRLSELLAVLRRAWTGQRFSFSGSTIALDRVRVTPAPWREGGVPIWLGGYAARALRRAGEVADGHLVGKGTPAIVDAATAQLRRVRSPADPGFTRGVSVACVLDEPGAGAANARRGFTRQQQTYERIQAGRDVYGGLVADPTGASGLAHGTIEAYLQAAGPTEQVVATLHEVLRSLRDWSRVHLVLRVLFPEPDLDTQLARLAAVGDRILPYLRSRAPAGQEHP